MKPLEEQLRKLAKKYIKEHGLMGTNANPVATWNVGFMEAVEWLIPHIQSYADRQAEQAYKKGCEDSSADKLLWDRMRKWQGEWRAEKPTERKLTYEDALALIEWKIEQARKEGYEQGRNESTKYYGVGIDQVEAIKNVILQEIREEIAGIKTIADNILKHKKDSEDINCIDKDLFYLSYRLKNIISTL